MADNREVYVHTCMACGEEFLSYDNMMFPYCSDECEDRDCFNPVYDEYVAQAQERAEYRNSPEGIDKYLENM